MSKWEMLYMLGIEKPKGKDRNLDEIIIEKDPENYTFRPDLSLT